MGISNVEFICFPYEEAETQDQYIKRVSHENNLQDAKFRKSYIVSSSKEMRISNLEFIRFPYEKAET